MKKSGFLDQQKALCREYALTAERITRQIMLDTLQIMLHREFGFGYDRIKKVTDKWGEYYSYYHDALTGGVESDVVQEHLDRALAEFLNGHQELIPFEERYEDIRKISYEKGRKK